MACTILRGGQPRYQGRVNTREMKRPRDELVSWLCRGNTCRPAPCYRRARASSCPHALAEGDVVEITLERVASLRNPVRRLPA